MRAGLEERHDAALRFRCILNRPQRAQGVAKRTRGRRPPVEPRRERRQKPGAAGLPVGEQPKRLRIDAKLRV